MASHFGSNRCFPIITIIEYTMHIKRLMIIAETPKVMIISLKYETRMAVSLPRVTGFRASSLPRKIKSKKQQLQMTVKREKKETIFIENNSLKMRLPK